MAEAPLSRTAAGEIDAGYEGREVRLAGWVAARRDHGGVVFVDLRDASGIVQVVVNPEDQPEAGAVADGLRDEFCIAVTGVVRRRPPGSENPGLATGEVEVAAAAVSVLSPSQVLPFQIDDRAEVDELRRLEYRYLDLRRSRMAANLAARSRAFRAMRSSLEAQGFLEVETPTLVRSTPEGARDFLVPSRLRPGSFSIPSGDSAPATTPQAGPGCSGTWGGARSKRGRGAGVNPTLMNRLVANIEQLRRDYPRNRLLWLETGSTLLRANKPADGQHLAAQPVGGTNIEPGPGQLPVLQHPDQRILVDEAPATVLAVIVVGLALVSGTGGTGGSDGTGAFTPGTLTVGTEGTGTSGS